ncbi:MAG: hypothetical protein WCC06_07540 [Candidatus Aminicenantales bacterium]
MAAKGDIIDESSLIISEIESNLQKALLKKKEQVERELQEKIRKEKEESEKKILKIEKEFEKERESLKDYRNVMAEFESARVEIQKQMKEHLDQGIQYQKEIEKLTALTLEELKIVSELSLKLAGLRQESEEKAFSMKKTLEEKFGHSFEVPESIPQMPESNEIEVNLEHELSKLKKIKELLETETNQFEPNPELEKFPAPDNNSGEMEPSPDPLSFKIPEIHEFMENEPSVETEKPPSDEKLKEKGEAKKKILDENNFQMAYQMLEQYRRSEPTDYNGEISYFQSGERILLDGESIIRAMTLVIEEAKKLYQKLSQTESPKEQFFVKQELINNQEVLRKIILRSVKMCEKESCSLPKFTDKIMNIEILKEILEKLNMNNWSNQDDFISFEEYSVKLRDAYYKSITPPALYLHSLLEELEG